jgi:hypothetical protein
MINGKILIKRVFNSQFPVLQNDAESMNAAWDDETFPIDNRNYFV